MGQNKIDMRKYVKKETMLMVAFITFTAGFLSGIAYGLYKGEPRKVARVEQQQAADSKFGSEISALELEVAKNPANIKAWTQLGNLYFDTNKYDRAIVAYKKSLELNPQNADVWTDMGVMYRRSGNPTEALSSFEKAIQLNPRHEQARFNKGIVQFYDLGNLEEAKKTGGKNAELVVIVARDCTVKTRKGKKPVMPEDQRRRLVESLKVVDEAILGWEDFSIDKVIEKIKPDIIAIGHDQDGIEQELRKAIEEKKVVIKVANIGRFGKRELDSSSKIVRKIIETANR